MRYVKIVECCLEGFQIVQDEVLSQVEGVGSTYRQPVKGLALLPAYPVLY
jgi:hypothetical protein